jgi:trk system potassium uptake protein TrkA
MAKPNGGKPSVCIMGCGRVGALLAAYFYEQHYAVQVIDINAEAFNRLSEKDIRDRHTTVGDGTDPAVLKRAGVATADIFIAVTNGDNRNIMASQIAQRQFNVAQVICRVYDPMRHAICRERLGIQSICPTLIGRDAIIAALTDARTSQKA